MRSSRTIFGYTFDKLDEDHLQDLLSLERERAIYSDHWIDELHDARHVRIRLSDTEALEYARSMKALDLFRGAKCRWARDVDGIPKDIAARADTYQMHLRDGGTIGPPYHCPAAFMGRHLEAIVCGMDPTRREVLEEQGRIAFLSTVRRAVDALTPAMRCFTNREKRLAPWPVLREDDVRDLLYAMLRASISDIKREEPIPSRAGKSQVADLYSGLSKILIEVKWVRRGRWRKILAEIYADIQTYGRHPDCEHLIFVIVDASREIPDPHLVESQLSGEQTIGEKRIRVIAYVREP